MTLQLLQFKAGIVKDITEYSANKNGPFWIDGDLVRFRNGYPTKIGGWEQQIYYNNADTQGLVNFSATSVFFTGMTTYFLNAGDTVSINSVSGNTMAGAATRDRTCVEFHRIGN